MSTFNVPLAEEVLRSIIGHPEEHDQSTWFEVTDYEKLPKVDLSRDQTGDAAEESVTVTVQGMLEGSCGSTACIAGWAALLSGWKVRTTKITWDDGFEEVESIAVSPEGTKQRGSVDFEEEGGELLGLDYDDAHFLFYNTEGEQAIVVLYGHIKGVENPRQVTSVARHLGIAHEGVHPGYEDDDLAPSVFFDLTGVVVAEIRKEYPPLTVQEWEKKHISA